MACCISFDSYIKPQRYHNCQTWRLCCISFDSYIKPQPVNDYFTCFLVVYLLIPTSNHNLRVIDKDNKLLYIFWFLHQTTTYGDTTSKVTELYIFWFLHQTTTIITWTIIFLRCISFDSYIKPQPFSAWIRIHVVVYLLIPTSNHNCNWKDNWNGKLYIFWFLHQTTTEPDLIRSLSGCISFDSYIKPQLLLDFAPPTPSCISFDSYIKPQLMSFL